VSAPGDKSHSLETFHKRLHDLCANDLGGSRHDRARFAKDQAEHACALGGENSLLSVPGLTWAEYCSATPGSPVTSEHRVELDEESGRMVKITIPPKFGLIPQVLTHSVPNLRGEPGERKAIEFLPATPLEYLERWMAANEIFGDDVRLTSVIRWADDQVSFAISQPQYHGAPATEAEIDESFRASGWTAIRDPERQHQLFFNYAYSILAVDALPRNCYINEDGLLPFDVILYQPDEEMEEYLGLYE